MREVGGKGRAPCIASAWLLAAFASQNGASGVTPNARATQANTRSRIRPQTVIGGQGFDSKCAPESFTIGFGLDLRGMPKMPVGIDLSSAAVLKAGN